MSKSPEVLTSLKGAFAKFEQGCSFPDDDVHRDTQLKRFELNYEPCWKLMAAKLEDIGNKIFGVKRVFRMAPAIGLIDDFEPWNRFCKLRNDSAHVCNDLMARAVIDVVVVDFRRETAKLIARATEIHSEI